MHERLRFTSVIGRSQGSAGPVGVWAAFEGDWHSIQIDAVWYHSRVSDTSGTDSRQHMREVQTLGAFSDMSEICS